MFPFRSSNKFLMMSPGDWPPTKFQPSNLVSALNRSGTACQKRIKKKDQDHTKWAIHIEAIAEIVLTSKAYLKQMLLSPEIKAHMNLPLLLVPILQKKTSSIESEEIKRAIAQHSTVLLSISKSFSSKILSLSQPLPSLSNATLCTTLMAVTTPEGKKLFLSAYPNWNGQGFIISYPTIYAKQAYDFVEYLPTYLSHSHGEEIYCWFTLDAVNKAKAMGWDVDKKQPISQDGLALCTTLQNLKTWNGVLLPPLPLILRLPQSILITLPFHPFTWLMPLLKHNLVPPPLLFP